MSEATTKDGIELFTLLVRGGDPNPDAGKEFIRLEDHKYAVGKLQDEIKALERRLSKDQSKPGGGDDD